MLRWAWLGVVVLCGCSSSATTSPATEPETSDAGRVADAGGGRDTGAPAAEDAASAADAGDEFDASVEAATVDPLFGSACQGTLEACPTGLDCCPGWTGTGIDPTYDGGVEMNGRCTKYCGNDDDCTGAGDSRGVFPPGTRCVITNDGTGHQGTAACVPPTKPPN